MKEELKEVINNEFKGIEVPIVDDTNIGDYIYEIRGQKVMLDFDLAVIYGYKTKNFNRQVKNNINKFPDDFKFQLTSDELFDLARCKKITSRIWTDGNKGGRTSLPYAFTEQGIYMLMTVLKGELATKQSLALIKAFKTMKDYIVESSSLLTNTNQYIENRFSSIDKRFKMIEGKLDVVMDSFVSPSSYKHFLIMDGQRIEANIAYQSIYKIAKRSIIIVDDYINIKTLRNLKVVDKNINIIIISDNVSKESVTASDITDFYNDTGIGITIKPSNNRFHDRYIIIDSNDDNQCIYHCGSSSKDSGNKITTIVKLDDISLYLGIIEELMHR